MNQTADSFFARAEQHFQDGDVENALSDLDRAILLAPENLAYRQLRAELRHQAEQHALAIEDFSAILDIASDLDTLVDVHEKRAIAYEAMGLYSNLIEDLTWLINHGIKRVNVYVWRGHHHQRLGRFQDALADFSQALALSPNNAELLIQLAQCRYHEGQYEAAIQDLTSILGLDRSTPAFLSAVYHWRGKAYYKLDHTQQALTDFNEALRLSGGKLVEDAEEYLNMVFDDE